MDIRTKLVFALVSVSLLSMAALGVFTVLRVEAGFRERTDEQLNGLAVFKQEALEQVLDGWRDRVALVASRTQLRLSLAEHNRTGSAASAERVERILQDAADAAPLFRELWVHDPGGEMVGRAGAEVNSGPIPEGLPEHDAAIEGIRYEGVAFPEEGLPVVGFTTELVLDDELLGYLHVVLSTDEISALSDNYEGLGETGETVVVARDRDGRLRTMHPVRFPPPSLEGSGYLLERDGAAAQSLAGGEVRLTKDLSDYRGEVVYIATRYIPATDWGLVVKVDEVEQSQPMIQFRQEMAQLAVTLAAFTILFGTFLGFRFAQPIHVLAETASKIAAGDLKARSGLTREDEVGLLARTFDQMAQSLEEQVGLLTEFRRFFDVSIDMMCIASTDGYFKRVNRACIRELGWSEEELLARPFIAFVHPDDHRATAAEIQKLAGGQPTIRFTNRFLCANGSYTRIRWNAYPEAETGRLYAIARVRSEQPDAAGSSPAVTQGETSPQGAFPPAGDPS
jgi:PAS domain S-box-containing protein